MSQAQSFTEVFEEIKANVSTSKSGKPVKSFSRSDFDKLAKAYLNSPDYVIEAAGTKGGEMVTKQIESVKLFRGMIQRILIDFGVDKQEAATILDASKEIKNVDGIYELCSELVYQYMNAGKKFDFITREDFAGSLTLKEMGETTTEHTDIRTKEKYKISKKPHKLLDKKSKAPSWLKKRL